MVYSGIFRYIPARGYTKEYTAAVIDPPVTDRWTMPRHGMNKGGQPSPGRSAQTTRAPGSVNDGGPECPRLHLSLRSCQVVDWSR